ncbi:MAG: hypothetical protein LQ342_006745 [Letrouitia transgressa]|nr:MAG: hypothetical protein LQ342_006745 [Letrouitia transgressa]
MSINFGFSVGDVIAVINVIRTSIRAFNETKGSSTTFQSLIQELHSLEDSLEAVEAVQAESLNGRRTDAIRRAVKRCHQCINVFVRDIAKYQPWLRPKSTEIRATAGKIKWALCRNDDIVRFRDQVMHHQSALQTLLLVQANSKVSTVEEAQEKMLHLSTEVATQSGHTHKHVLAIEASINNLTRQNSRAQRENQNAMMQLLCELRNLQGLPPQVLLPQPVTLKDACGDIYPFHLTFIPSLEALVAVLKFRFKTHGVSTVGLRKLETKEFIFREQDYKISVRRPWASVFKPGQRVDMSMIYYNPTPKDIPSDCRTINPELVRDLTEL